MPRTRPMSASSCRVRFAAGVASARSISGEQSRDVARCPGARRARPRRVTAACCGYPMHVQHSREHSVVGWTSRRAARRSIASSIRLKTRNCPELQVGRVVEPGAIRSRRRRASSWSPRSSAAHASHAVKSACPDWARRLCREPLLGEGERSVPVAVRRAGSSSATRRRRSGTSGCPGGGRARAPRPRCAGAPRARSIDHQADDQVVVGAQRRADEVVLERDVERLAQQRARLVGPVVRSEQALVFSACGEHLRQVRAPRRSRARTRPAPARVSSLPAKWCDARGLGGEHRDVGVGLVGQDRERRLEQVDRLVDAAEVPERAAQPGRRARGVVGRPPRPRRVRSASSQALERDLALVAVRRERRPRARGAPRARAGRRASAPAWSKARRASCVAASAAARSPARVSHSSAPASISLGVVRVVASARKASR